MTPTEEKILTMLEALQHSQERLEQSQAQNTTVLEALGAGVQDIREHMATKDSVDIAVEAAKIELKADIFASIAPVTRKVQNYKRRIKGLEKQAFKPYLR